MSGPSFRHILRESRNLILICAVVFGTLLAAWVFIGKRYDNKGYLERAYKQDVAELRAKGLNKEADALKRDKTIAEQETRIQERKAKGDTVAPEAYVPVWLYKGLNLNLAIAGVLLLLSPFLGRKRNAEMKFAQCLPPPPFPKWQIAAVLAVMAFATWQNAPRLFHSMWGDEEFNASRFILDYVEHDKVERDGKPVRNDDGTFQIVERPWITTLWNMRKPTNHLGYSFFARLTHDTFFHEGTGPNDPWFSEPLLRTPVFISGLLLIPALLWSLRVWGLKGWWALLFMVVHPWFVRFGVDGRGYGFVMLGITLLTGITGKALQTGRWRWWLLFGLGEFFIFWSNLHSAYLLVALNLMVLACFFTLGMNGSAIRLQLSRWFIANMLAVMLLVGWMSPCLPQLVEYLKEGDIRDTLDLRWWQDSFSALGFGMPWLPWDEPQNPLISSLSQSASRAPIVYGAGILLFVAVALWGIVAMARNARLRPLLLLIVGAPAIMILHMAVSHVRPYDWYLVPYLPGLMFLMAAAFHPFAKARGRCWALGIMILTLALFICMTRRQRRLLREYPLESSRESVAFYRPVINPRHRDIDQVLSAGLAMYSEGYDPVLYRIKDEASMRELMAEADRSGKPLWFNCGYMRYMRVQENTAPMCKVLEDDTLFEHAKTFWGLLPFTTRDVYRYRGHK